MGEEKGKKKEKHPRNEVSREHSNRLNVDEHLLTSLPRCRTHNAVIVTAHSSRAFGRQSFKCSSILMSAVKGG